MNRMLLGLFVLVLAFAGFSGSRSLYALTAATRVRTTTTTNVSVVTPPPTNPNYQTPYLPK